MIVSMSLRERWLRELARLARWLDPRPGAARGSAAYRPVVVLVAVTAVGFFVPSLLINAVPTARWPAFIAGAALAAAVVPSSFFVARRSTALAVAWAAANAVVLCGLVWLYRDYYALGPLLIALLVVVHAAAHGLRAGLAAAAVGALALPLILHSGGAPWVEATYAAIFLGGSAVVPWTAVELARRRLLDEHGQIEQQLRQRAFSDPLTGLANRLLLRERLEHAVARSPRASGRVALLFVDLDGFKAVNDEFGHAAGDRLLRAIAERLGGEVRAADTLARVGGDEFVVLLEDLRDPKSAARLAERLALALDAPFELGGRAVRVAASVGLAVQQPGQDAEALLEEADRAMYAAKRAARPAEFAGQADAGYRPQQP